MNGETATERIDTVVIGGGQAGLSAGYHLAKRGMEFVILDADARIGDHWRERWDSLRLYSPARSDGLPGFPFPAAAYHYPTGREMGDYLATYADRLGLPVRSGVRVERVERDAGGDGFVVTAGGRSISARQVVVATGPFRIPNVPAFAGQLDPAIRQLHSDEYRNPSQLQDGPVLVVGLAHSGGDIAFEVAASHRTILSGAFHGQIPFRVIDTPRARIVWPIITFVFSHLLTIRTPMGKRMRAAIRSGSGGAPLLRVRLPDLDAAGVERHDARTVGVKDGKPVLADGTVLDVANVIWCTGYRRDYSWIGAPVAGRDGWPEEVRGVSPTVPGLYYLGIPFTYAFTSMLVGGAGRDARYVVDRIAERVRATAESAAMTPAAAR
ncbi:MAG TPA: FAD-dependent oxidoreductase [Verrucomicrobiae bacterium]|jgi:putative flavoprotein involved in K+ transport|nr:FAD-dependent oxidoreductase [Verrucomicrobiae bacterium]